MNKTNKKELYHKALMGRSMVLDLIGECDRAIEGQRRAIQYFKTRVAGNSPLLLSLMIELAHILVDRKCDYEQGEEIAKHVLLKAKKSKDARLHGDAVAMIALIALNRSKYKMALKYYQKLLKIFEETSQRDKLCQQYWIAETNKWGF